jgi:hypothetical protein
MQPSLLRLDQALYPLREWQSCSTPSTAAPVGAQTVLSTAQSSALAAVNADDIEKRKNA